MYDKLSWSKHFENVLNPESLFQNPYPRDLKFKNSILTEEARDAIKQLYFSKG